jgi:transposase
MKQRQVFSKEFKVEAVRLLETSDRPAAEVARQLGIRRNQLYKCSKSYVVVAMEHLPGQAGRRRTTMSSRS